MNKRTKAYKKLSRGVVYYEGTKLPQFVTYMKGLNDLAVIEFLDPEFETDAFEKLYSISDRTFFYKMDMPLKVYDIVEKKMVAVKNTDVVVKVDGGFVVVDAKGFYEFEAE